MNVLFISPSNTIGGAEMSLIEMARFLQANENQVFIALPDAADTRYIDLLRPYVREVFFVPLLAWNKINLPFLQRSKGWLYRLYRSKGGWLYTVPRLVQIIRRHQIDLVHTNTIMALDGAIAAKIAGIPHVQHLREITGYRKDAIYVMVGQQHKRVFYRLMNWLHTTLIANSEYTKQSYAGFVPEHKTRVIYNSVAAGNLNTVPATLNQPAINLVANVTSKVKNHRLFVQIAAEVSRQLPHATFHIYGRLPAANDPYLLDLQQMVERLGISDKLTFEGLENDTAAIYQQTTILIHTYPYESFGRIFIEAMAHGVPVVAVRGGGADELISDGENGFLFEQADIQTAVQQVVRLCNDPALYVQITDQGRQFAQQFRGEIVGQQLIDLYQRLLPA